MPELSIFDHDLSQRVFLIATILFIALYAAAFLFLRGRPMASLNGVMLHSRAAAVALFIAAAVTAVGGGLGLFNTASGAANRPASMSIGALHATMDMRALPVQQVDQPF